MKRICAIDYGSSRTGWAISDVMHVIVSDSGFLRRVTDEQLIIDIQAMISEKNIGKIIVGLPFNMSGKYSSKTTETERFIEKLTETIKISVDTIDERLTSVQATRNLQIIGVKTGHNKGQIDAMSASVMLETWLQKKSFRKTIE